MTTEDDDIKNFKFWTAPFDPRFPNQNQTKCQKLKGKDYEPCNYFKRVFTSICPVGWVEKWNDQIERGIFAGTI